MIKFDFKDKIIYKFEKIKSRISNGRDTVWPKVDQVIFQLLFSANPKQGCKSYNDSRNPRAHEVK